MLWSSMSYIVFFFPVSQEVNALRVFRLSTSDRLCLLLVIVYCYNLMNYGKIKRHKHPEHDLPVSCSEKLSPAVCSITEASAWLEAL